MPRVTEIPAALRGRPFTRADAVAAGVSLNALRGPHFDVLVRGVYRCKDDEPTFALWVLGILLTMPKDAVISHVTALWWYGVRIGSQWPMHFSTNGTRTSEQKGVRLHRRRGRLRPVLLNGREVTGPDRTFVDCATVLPFVQLVMAADWLIHAGHTSLTTLRGYVESSHIHGVVRARMVLAYVAEGAESPMETLIRLLIVFARLPAPECNVEILSAGRFIARCDLVYRVHKVAVEYDGIWHEREPAQRRRDLHRREELEALGWTVIVVTSEDLKHKRQVVLRVHRALVAHGYTGPAPIFNDTWQRWFS